jgi:hypothetical protein
VAQVLKILMDNHLYLKAEKCTFHAQEVEFLGTICGNGQFRMDPLKVQAILDWPVPRNVKDVQTFISASSRSTLILRGFCQNSLAKTNGLGTRSNWKHLISAAYHSEMDQLYTWSR